LQLADQENEQRRRLEQAALKALNKPDEEVIKRNKLNQKKQQVSDGGDAETVCSHLGQIGTRNNCLTPIPLANTSEMNDCVLQHLCLIVDIIILGEGV
jgi:hypothetical protein